MLINLNMCELMDFPVQWSESVMHIGNLIEYTLLDYLMADYTNDQS